MRKRLRMVLVAGLCLAASIVVPAVGSEGTVGIRLVDAPVDRADDPRALVYIVDHLAPGSAISRRVEVRNDTSEPITLELYTAGAHIDAGSFRFLDGRSGNELSDWIAVDPPRVDLAPGASAMATVALHVPLDASQGERYAMVWAELPPSDLAGGNVAIVNRVGIRLYISVGPGGEPPSDFEVEELRARRDAGGVPIVAAQVRNTGGRALDLTGELELGDGPAGLSAGPFDVELGTTLAPGDTAPVDVVLDPALPDGSWNATLVMRSGRVERSVSARLTFLDAGEPGMTVLPVEAPADRGWLLVLLAAGLLVIVVLGLLIALLRRRREDDDEDAPDLADDRTPHLLRSG